ncbi:sphingoid long-chain bases kinase 2, mitochondrial-like [Dorcoceras hygrometricum]|uniref:Sphingoid long-chain bases kinase 2, mitochondrial-like n=1 Tax=Dorcoceras hygrometricum TaxID=472368 RepID=A0A2Z7CAT1_9LAMI|nr:sphingoid long-chain bases kinase 2, mitochondrial-like [Dorcoceras hygrometricum]
MIAIGSIATLDLPMVVDLIGIYGLKGPYCTLTTTNWFLQALSVIPRGSWGDVARRSYHDPLDALVELVARAIDRYDDVDVTYSFLLVVFALRWLLLISRHAYARALRSGVV